MSTVQVHISDDYYKAYIDIKVDDTPLELEDVIKALKDRNIQFGTDLEVINALIAMNENIYEELIAEGQPHIHGVDAQILMAYDSHESHPELKEDGTVDFKNMDFLQKVMEGEVLATKIPASEGLDGITVTGKTIHAKNGKDIQIKCGENIILSEDGLTASAACDGVYKPEGDKLVVKNYLELKDGVGVETGNIAFKGDIFVKGNVISGYAIECDGNLTIDGIVEDAKITVTGDLTVSKGIAGHKGSIVICGGNLVAKFIDNADVKVKGTLEVDEILNSKILCDGEVLVQGKKGHIVGGEITARYAIKATTIGSKLGVITLINLGVDIESVEELKELKAIIAKEKETEVKLKRLIEVLSLKKTKGIITPEEEESLDRCSTGIKQTQLIIKEKEARIKELHQLFLKAKSGSIKTETIYPDTMVRIGKSSYFIDEAVLRSIIKKSNDEIVAIGF